VIAGRMPLTKIFDRDRYRSILPTPFRSLSRTRCREMLPVLIAFLGGALDKVSYEQF
jgi:hypothetical protein